MKEYNDHIHDRLFVLDSLIKCKKIIEIGRNLSKYESSFQEDEDEMHCSQCCSCCGTEVFGILTSVSLQVNKVLFINKRLHFVKQRLIDLTISI